MVIEDYDAGHGDYVDYAGAAISAGVLDKEQVLQHADAKDATDQSMMLLQMMLANNFAHDMADAKEVTTI